MIKKKIITVDDEPVMSALIKELLSDETDLEIVQITTNKKEFFDAVAENSFDIALVDISVGEREGGIEILKSLKEKDIHLPAIVLSAHEELMYALKCLKTGARGYISKDCICSDLVIGLKEVLAGNLFVSGQRGKSILEEYAKLSDN
jgi:two-component system invasion response regulator UvrY